MLFMAATAVTFLAPSLFQTAAAPAAASEFVNPALLQYIRIPSYKWHHEAAAM
jgi:hypothetical protein